MSGILQAYQASTFAPLSGTPVLNGDNAAVLNGDGDPVYVEE